MAARNGLSDLPLTKVVAIEELEEGCAVVLSDGTRHLLDTPYAVAAVTWLDSFGYPAEIIDGRLVVTEISADLP